MPSSSARSPPRNRGEDSSNNNNNNNRSDQQSMGAIFQQRRAAAAATKNQPGSNNNHHDHNQQHANNNNNDQNNGSSSATPSLREIQAEQARERERDPPSSSSGRGSNYHNNNNRNNNNNRSRSPKPKGGGGSNNQGGGNYRGNGGGGGGGGRRSRQQPNRSNLPIEHGAVCSLKESFGFMRCAERPEEIFFHYSELKDKHPADLKIGDEMEFRVGASSRGGGGGGDGGGGDKLAAYQVKSLPAGAIVWETEDEPGRRFRGVVERPVRTDRGGNTTNDGTIRLVSQDTQTNKGEDHDGADVPESIEPLPDSPMIRFTPSDYHVNDSATANPAPDGGNSDAFTSGRAGSRRAPNRLSRGDLVEFTLVTEKRTKDKCARGITMILSERDRTRMEQEKRMLEAATLEHGVITALKGDYGFLKSNKRREEVFFHQSSFDVDSSANEKEEDESTLKEGQEVKFLVVEEGAESGPRRRASARRLQIQPRGSVRFYDLMATGMTGVVTLCPQPVDSGHALETHGKVRLASPLMDKDENGEPIVIEEVYLRTKDSPGGTFPFRGGSSVGLWIEIGDTLLFDVVKDFVDGACRAVPTNHVTPRENPGDISDVVDNRTDYYDKDDKDEVPRAVRLVSLTLAGRAEGAVNTVKDTFGFIHFAERPVDAHFKLFQLLPEELQKDLRRTMGMSDVDENGKPLELSVGCEVQFDLSVHGTIHSTAHTGRHRGRPQLAHERENLKAQRILLLPPKTICQEYRLASGVKAVVSKEDQKQPYAGSLDLETPVKTASPDQRHPLVAKLIDSYLQSDVKTPLTFHDIQSLKEDETVLSMLELKGRGRLTWKYIPVEEEPGYSGRLCIEKIANEEPSAESEADTTEEARDDELEDEGVAEKTEKPGKLSKKKKPAKAKTVKTIRFDKGSLLQELKEDVPPAVGDVVEVDIVQSRRTGQSSVTNMKMIERHVPEVSVTDASEVGVVKEVVTGRKFGFISLLDEAATSREVVFFSFSNVVAPELAASNKPFTLRRGDEVKFNIGTEKNGKRVAVNVTPLPKGTIPSKAEKNACRGYLLMAPSHTSLKNTPLRHTASNASQGSEKSSRWDGVEVDRKKSESDEPLTDQGCILLLDDPTGMFKRRTPPQKSDSSGSNGMEQVATENGEESKTPIMRHLRYKVGALAIHGTGSSSDEASHPRRGDMVTFVKGKSGSGIRDIRIMSRNAAELVRGRLEDIQREKGEESESLGRAKFKADNSGKVYEIDLSEVISCDVSVLKENELVEGVLHDGNIYGICRTVDLYLETKVAISRKERPKLNLTVKKDRGGTIIAQSMMAKGPDGTTGFAPGWTARTSKFASGKTEAKNERESNA